METSTNWAGNYFYQARQILQPESIEQLQDVVRHSRKVRALGTRHSFNDIADSPENLVSLNHFDKILDLDREHQTVTVEAGVRYGELCRWLDREGFALHNLASLPHISVAGACATGTHGSGNTLGNLATIVSAMEIMTADGELLNLSRKKNAEIFDGTVVALGGLGIVTKLTLDVCPGFQMQQDVYEGLPLIRLEGNFDELTSLGYSVSIFTNWSSTTFNQVWLKRRVTDGASLPTEPELLGAKLATRQLHPIASMSAENCTEQMGICGPWYERLPHFRMGFTPSSGEELQSEYILPRRHAIPAFQEILAIKDHITPHLQISEIRTIAADNLWMSPCYRQDSVAIHFTWKKDWESVRQILPFIEEQLSQFEARPHWGKLFTMQPDRLQSLYEKLTDFRDLLQQFDPEGKFRNAFLEKNVFSEAGSS
jgi:xylitol oxidase